MFEASPLNSQAISPGVNVDIDVENHAKPMEHPNGFPRKIVLTNDFPHCFIMFHHFSTAMLVYPRVSNHIYNVRTTSYKLVYKPQ